MKARKIGLIAGPLAFALMLLLPGPAGMSQAGVRTAAVALLMVIWWITEAIPIPATSLIPLVAFPWLGIMNGKQTALNYGDHNIYLFLGGFLMALSIEKWGLHKRIALQTIRVFGTSKRTLVLGFMAATALLSMWVSNTATTVMMLPIAIAVLDRFKKDNESDRLAVALLLGIAYAASVGGIGTLIGTPPNIVLAGQVRKLVSGGAEIGFGQWMLLALPLVVVMLPIVWLVLVRLASPVSKEKVSIDVRGELAELGPMSRGEKIVLAVFVLTALAWIVRRPLISKVLPLATDTTIAIAAAVLLFAIPVDLKKREFALDWKQTKRLPWGVLLLFGGGFALAAGMESSGLTAWISNQLLVLRGLPEFVVVFLTCLLMAGLTELTSNTATTITMLPVLAAAAKAMGINAMTLMIPATMAASCAFMLPVATPPNAIVFGSGRIKLAKMFKTGLWLEGIGAVLITLLVCSLGKFVFPG
jgi:solute carrier family 13 (sodium-dependent dicarboxylate transporter), member 2/3/5